MSDELRECPLCKSTYAVDEYNSEIAGGCYPVYGCDICEVFASSPEKWNSLARRPVWLSERPTVPGDYQVRFADPELYAQIGSWFMYADQEYVDDMARHPELRVSREHLFAGPFPEPMEPIKQKNAD